MAFIPQPWKFSIDANTIRIYPDYSRRLPIVDPDNHTWIVEAALR
ncbi:MAG: hypothetical protein RIG63_04560 [Coleofasciculus chthonoplastes F3-SA18-01]